MDYCHKQRQFIVTKIRVADQNEQNEIIKYTEKNEVVMCARTKNNLLFILLLLIVRPEKLISFILSSLLIHFTRFVVFDFCLVFCFALYRTILSRELRTFLIVLTPNYYIFHDILKVNIYRVFFFSFAGHIYIYKINGNRMRT